MRYFIDDFGRLWSDRPPCVFDGVLLGYPKWLAGVISAGAEEVTAAKANEIIQRHRDEAIRDAFKQRIAEIAGEK